MFIQIALAINWCFCNRPDTSHHLEALLVSVVLYEIDNDLQELMLIDMTKVEIDEFGMSNFIRQQPASRALH